jgi:hypothetical protein
MLDITHDEAVPRAEEPRVFDTYAVVYAFTVLLLVPGAILVGRLPFRTYTLPYVSLVTVPFVLAIVAAFLTDSVEPLLLRLRRTAILVPLVVLTGVTILFLSAMLIVPARAVLGGVSSTADAPMAGMMLAALALPLAFALWRRLGRLGSVFAAMQALALVLALALVTVVVYVSLWSSGGFSELADAARKDVIIYIIGGLAWYAPSFGLAAGVWRRIGLV